MQKFNRAASFRLKAFTLALREFLGSAKIAEVSY